MLHGIRKGMNNLRKSMERPYLSYRYENLENVDSKVILISEGVTVFPLIQLFKEVRGFSIVNLFDKTSKDLFNSLINNVNLIIADISMENIEYLISNNINFEVLSHNDNILSLSKYYDIYKRGYDFQAGEELPADTGFNIDFKNSKSEIEFTVIKNDLITDMKTKLLKSGDLYLIDQDPNPDGDTEIDPNVKYELTYSHSVRLYSMKEEVKITSYGKTPALAMEALLKREILGAKEAIINLFSNSKHLILRMILDLLDEKKFDIILELLRLRLFKLKEVSWVYGKGEISYAQLFIMHGNIEFIKSLINNFNLNINDSIRIEEDETHPPLFMSTSNPEVYRYFIEIGADVIDNFDAILKASYDKEAFKMLIDKGIDINMKNRNKTLLMRLMSTENYDAVQLLLDNGVDITVKDSETRRWGKNALEIAQSLTNGKGENGHTKMIELITNHMNKNKLC